MNRTLTLFALAALPTLAAPLAGCGDTMTAAEAAQALEEAALSDQASQLTAAGVEITTNFTIGEAAANAAQALQTFVTSQLPCAEVTVSGNALTIAYGVNPGNCTYNGHTFSGTHAVRIDKNDQAEVLVHHEWTDFSNGVVSVTGTADVTWDFQDPSRHVAHELTWTRLKDGRTGTGTGDRTFTPLAGGLSEGFALNGSRHWSGVAGEWDLTIDGVEVRWADPVPQAGTYTLVTPKNKTATLAFERKDADTITVTLKSGRKTFTFDVTKAGDSTQTGES